MREESKEGELSHDGPTDSLSLPGRVWEKLRIRNSSLKFKGFVESLAESPSGESENLQQVGKTMEPRRGLEPGTCRFVHSYHVVGS